MLNKIKTFLVKLIGKIHWKQTHAITDDDRAEIRKQLTSHYYLIVTRRSNHLSTFAICFMNWWLTGKWGFYSHILMNTENDVVDDSDFRLVEAIGTGVTYSSFWKVFGKVDAVGLIKPKNLSIDEWTNVLDKARTEIGKPYDTLFDLTNDKSLSCVELVRVALSNEPNYKTDFANFEKMIRHNGNLTPQMFVDCEDFEVIWHVKR